MTECEVTSLQWQVLRESHNLEQPELLCIRKGTSGLLSWCYVHFLFPLQFGFFCYTIQSFASQMVQQVMRRSHNFNCGGG